ncbi:MAG: RlmE family RNA methyltransferase [Rhodospirillaceae bacterium]|nr:RlmE family RNA methyltransferase [Rhodospirillaceae bacterium]
MSGDRRGGGESRGGTRMLHTRVKTARGRKSSSTRWLQRQLNDPYVVAARREGYRSRAAFKLVELNERFDILKPGQRVVDLGCAPGGWTQVAVAVVKPESSGGQVVGLDILDMDQVPGATTFVCDFTEDDAPDRLKALLGGPVDVVLSDMAANTTGHPQTDHLRIIALLELAYAFAREVLTEGGCFVAKVFQGGAESEFLAGMKRDFVSVRHAKPPASRKDSAEMYVVATGFRKAADL